MVRGLRPGLLGTCTLCLLLSGTGAARSERVPEPATPIVFTQLPADAAVCRGPGRAGGMLRADYGEGCRLVRLDPDGSLTVLSEGFAGACEPDVSFDGEQILFAGKERADDPWNIWEMKADGSGKRQVTRAAGNCRSPAYQATLYTIVSTEPWLQIMFVSDLAGELNEVGSGLATSLYSCKLDGTGLRRLTVNLSDDMDPFLMRDGRVLVACWQRMDLRRGASGRISLFGVNTDGADYALYSESDAARIRHMPCEVEGGTVVFVEADRVGWDGAGLLASVKTRRPFYSHAQVTAAGEYLFHSPAPLAEGAVLVSRRPADGSGTHGLFRLDLASGEAEAVFDDPARHDFHARLLAPRPRPDGRSSVVNEKIPTGKLYCLDATLLDPAVRSLLAAGTVRQVRVIEGVPFSAGEEVAPTVRTRLLGLAPVEADGSFQVEVPADVPIQLQTLDADGMALFSCGWIWAKHREWRGCIGCHEDPELVPENRFVEAVQKPAVQLTLPPERRRTVDFRKDVMPIVSARCVGCHDGSDGGLDLTVTAGGPPDRAWRVLLETTAEGTPRYVTPGAARTSPLVWWLFERNTSRPWDASFAPDQVFPEHFGPEVEALTASERTTFVEWIDLGAHWTAAREPGESDEDTGEQE